MNARIPSALVVDDEAPVRDLLHEALSPVCEHLCLAADSREALRQMESHPHDLLIADICMPGRSGIDLLEVADQLQWDCVVVLMTGHASLSQIAGGIRLQAADLLLKPFSLAELHNSVTLAYQKLTAKRQQRSRWAMLSSGFDDSKHELEEARHRLYESHRSALITLVATLEAREYETYAHSFRVRSYALHLAHLINYSPESLSRLAYAALLHDIGKISISDSILLKPDTLSSDEVEKLKLHSMVGSRIVGRMGFLDEESKIILHHHEAWNGQGYPNGLSGQEIPLGSRLFAVADTLDAMTSDRCYRKALSLAAARCEIERCAGTQFDPEIAKVFCSVTDDVWQDLRRQADAYAQAAIVPEFSKSECEIYSQLPVQQFAVIP